MANPTWSLLAKSQDDDETIEEAIDRIVAAHNADEEAHLGVGESLQSHKASEIIDHVAESVVADKIKERNVVITKLEDFGMERHSLALESLDGWDITSGVSLMGGTIDIQTGTIINTLRSAVITTWDGVDWAKKMTAQWRLKFLYDTEQESYFFIGGPDPKATENQACGFFVYDDTLYVFWRSGSEEESEQHSANFPAIDVTKYHIYRVEYTPNTNIKFYVDDELTYTASNYLIDTSWGGGGFTGFTLENLEAANKTIVITQVYFTGEN